MLNYYGHDPPRAVGSDSDRITCTGSLVVCNGLSNETEIFDSLSSQTSVPSVQSQILIPSEYSTVQEIEPSLYMLKAFRMRYQELL